MQETAANNFRHGADQSKIIVLYNGDLPWLDTTMSMELQHPRCPHQLKKYQPQAGFRLIDEKRVKVKHIDFSTEDLVAPIFAFEQISADRILNSFISLKRVLTFRASDFLGKAFRPRENLLQKQIGFQFAIVSDQKIDFLLADSCINFS